MSEVKETNVNIKTETDELKEAFETEEKEISKEVLDETAKAVVDELKELVDEADKPKKKAGKIALIVCGILVEILLIVYFGAVIFFQNHYQANTRLDNLDFSGKTVEEADRLLNAKIEDYRLRLVGRDDYTEELKGTDISLTHENEAELKALLEKQNAFLWFVPLVTGDKAEFELKVSYDEEKFIEVVEALGCFDKKRQVKPVSAIPVFDGTEFQIQEEEIGTKIDKDALTENISENINMLATELDLDKTGCYVAPTFTKDSKEVTDARDKANTWIQANVTYSADGEEVAVDKEKIAGWIQFSKKMKPSLNTDEVKAFVATLSTTYNSIGNTLEITTPTGKKAKVSGGTYGMKVDEDGEFDALVKEIKAGEVTKREPNYSQKVAGTKDEPWGETYLEVDLTQQHMWYIQKGEVTFESDVVTGVPNPKKRTPQGVYSVLEKRRNKVLRGEIQPNGKPEYLTPVAYWMRVTWTGIGFHDATWQRKFGGQRYKQGYGSHGCINMPYNAIKELYDKVEKGCPIVIHY